MNVTLKGIILSIYTVAELPQIYKIIKEFKLDHLFNRCIDLIDEKLKTEESEIEGFGFVQYGVIASNLLIGINESFRSNSKDLQKEEAEIVCADIAKEILKYILEKSKSDKSKTIQSISQALNEACSIYGYNNDELFTIMDLKGLIEYEKSLRSGIAVAPNRIYKTYQWIGNAELFKNLENLLIDQELIPSKQSYKLKNLCSGKELTKIGLNFNSEKSRYIMTLFSYLKTNKLLKGPKEGFYSPLINHGIDFQEKNLKNKTPRQFNDMLKKNQAEWANNTEMISKWLSIQS